VDEAVTVKAPSVALATRSLTVALPFTSVVGASTFEAVLVNVPLAPVPPVLAVKVTVTPCTGLPLPSVTCATSGAKPVLIATLWLFPLEIARFAGAPAVMVMPLVKAVTLVWSATVAVMTTAAGGMVVGAV
jgi:hypothetical protein